MCGYRAWIGFNKKYKMILEGARMRYDVIIIGAGPGGIFSAYELTKQTPKLKVAVFVRRDMS